MLGNRIYRLHLAFHSYIRGDFYFMNAVLSGQSSTIYGEGYQSRDFVHVSDVCQANLLALGQDPLRFRVFKVGSGESHTLLKLLEAIGQASGRQFDIQYNPDEIFTVDITKIKEALGYAPSQIFQEGSRSLVAYVEESGLAAADNVGTLTEIQTA